MKKIGSNLGEPLEIHHAESILGQVLVACTTRGIRAMFVGDDRETLKRKMREEFPLGQGISAGSASNQLVTAVVEHIKAGNSDAALPLDLSGTEFQLRVWGALRETPVGTTVNYTELAQRIGRPSAVRAVASACAANRIAVLIPCHRVIRKDGGMGGYRWGVERKLRLLELERARN